MTSLFKDRTSKWLITAWGDYNINNCLKLDVFITKEKDDYSVFLSMDQYKHKLLNFEAGDDADVYASFVRADLRRWLRSEEPEHFLSSTLHGAYQSVF